ncbi:MAG: CDP-diacylglycerol O-phosphatidyltransferase [Myxococcota bacterium]|nr:CDP-diacylglycerol O-phosphatidyltransferase [Myxococcota bacterium]
MTKGYTRTERAAGWLVHIYTALGLPLNFLSLFALIQGDAQRFLLLNLIAVGVDSSDGFLARRLKVWERVPSFDGAKLDDLVDFLTYAFLPAVALPLLGLLPSGWEGWALLPIMSSGYGFCQRQAKVEDAFVGFPSYWNIGLIYAVIFQPSPAVLVGALIFLSVMVFIPIHYLYPSKLRRLFWITNIFSTLYLVSLAALILAPNAPWRETLALYSLSFVLYYTVLSFLFDWQRRQHRSGS